MMKLLRETWIWISRWPMRIMYRLLGLRYFYSAWQSVTHTAQLFRSAKRTLYVVAGELNEDVWNKKPVRDALIELTSRANPPDIKIVFGPMSNADQETLEFLLSLARRRKLELYVVEERRPRHFAVADGMHVKMEEPHPPKAQFRCGYVQYNNPELAAALLGSDFPA